MRVAAAGLKGAVAARDRGGRVEYGRRGERVVVRGGRAVALRTAGAELPARRAVLADVTAPRLYGELLAAEHVPERLRAAPRRFHYDAGTVKVDWALSGPVPWAALDTRRGNGARHARCRRPHRDGRGGRPRARAPAPLPGVRAVRARRPDAPAARP